MRLIDELALREVPKAELTRFQVQAGGPGSGRHAGFASGFHDETHAKLGRLADKLQKQGWPSHATAFRGIQNDLASGKDFTQAHEDAMKSASKAIGTSENSQLQDHNLADKIDDLHQDISDHLAN